MKPRSIESIFRLTPLQEGLLFHTLEASRPGAYFDQYSATLEGAIDVKLFERAWNETVSHHAVLRTLFTWEKRDHPLQVVKASITLPFSVEDISQLEATAQQARLDEYLTSDRAQGFVLDEAPLMRLRLFVLGPNARQMVWSFHHLILDGWSVRLLLAEVRQRYEALSCGHSFQPKPAPSFEEFVSWQHNRPTDISRAYWQNYLRGFTTPTTPRVRSSRLQKSRAEALQTNLSLSAEFAERLSAYAKEHRVTLNTLFVAAWGVVLNRYCDSQDVVFGTTSAGRPPQLPGVEGTAGLFITTLPLRIDFSQHGTVDQLLSAIQKEQVAQREHDHIGLSSIQSCSEVLAGTPLFETLVVFENFPSFTQAEQHEFEWAREQFTEYSHYPLALLVVPGSPFELIIVHQPTAFSRADVERLLDSVVTALEGLMSHQLTQSIDCLSGRHKQELNSLTQGPELEVTVNSVIEQFEDQVRKVPSSTALSVAEQGFSYRQIDDLTNQLARHLQKTYPDACAIAIYAQRDHWAIIGQLASLKLGKLYVTVDAKDPPSRLNYVLQDLKRVAAELGTYGDPVLLTPAKLASISDQLDSTHALVRCDVVATEQEEATGFRRADVGKEDPAYVIYTSGSTGQPKGVLVSHGSLANSTSAREPFYGSNPSVFALLSSLATDSSIAGIYWTLCSGGTLVLPTERAELDVNALARLFVTEKVSHTLCVPSLYLLMLDALDEADCDSLNVVVVAGEACPLSLVRRHAATLPTVALYNEYGPSEACVWVTASKLRDSDEVVSIGSPVSNVQVAVVDRHQRLAPIGVAGELWVGGDNLADGYINRPEATEEAFVERSLYSPRDAVSPESIDDLSPNAQSIQQRYYRTGDKVVLSEEGQLEYLGRMDNQLKVRGFRVEPGEVEAALCQLDLIDAAVVLVDDSDFDAVVDALVATAQSSNPDVLERTLLEIEQMDEVSVERALVQLVESAHNSRSPTSND